PGSVPDHRERGNAAQLRALDDGSRLRRVQTDIGEQIEDGVDRAVDLNLGDKLANAHMRAETKAEGRLELAVDVEDVGVLEGVRVTVGGHHHALHEGTLGNLHAVELDVLGGLAHLE